MRTLSRAGLLFLAGLFAPAFVFAACPSLKSTLAPGSRGQEVVELQLFLIGAKFLAPDLATGYFGPLTQKSVRDLQAAAGIVSSGTPASTGWGIVGPKTRAHIASRCFADPAAPVAATTTASTTPAAQVPVCTPAKEPATACETAWTKVLDESGCAISWQCPAPRAPAQSDRPPIISGITGPQSVEAGTRAEWRINAGDPEGKALRYSFSWGDGGTFERILQIAQVFTDLPASAYTYAYPGIYTLTGVVRDQAGNTAEISASVVVSAATSSVSAPAAPAAALVPPSGGVSESAFDANHWETLLNTVTGGTGSVSGSKCSTPWGNKTLNDGETLPMEPYFTQGHESLTGLVPLMRCSLGSWLACDWKGEYCFAYGSTGLPSATITPAECPSFTTWCRGKDGYSYCAVPPDTCSP